MNARDMFLTTQPAPLKGASVREELRLHSRYIRDTLAPLISKQLKLSHSDSVCLQSIFKTLDGIPVTLDLLRYSRIEKALMIIIATGDAYWPIGVQVHAEELMAKWEDELGPLKNVRADLYGPGGRMEGVRKITWKDGRVPDDEAKSAWSVQGSPKPSRAHGFGHLGFEVGDWWLKPAAAYRDGIIDETSHGITANENGAYAIVLTGSCETDLKRDSEIRYKATIDDPGVFKLTKTMLREDPEEKVVRVLRSWKLRSKNAPKAGLRYDGLYRILSFSVHLSPPNTWHTTFTLSRTATQPPLLPALSIPTSDQLDDWKDYQRLKLIDRGDDFEMLREMFAGPSPATGGGDDVVTDRRHGSEDSGYFSRKGSKATPGGGGRDSIRVDEGGSLMMEDADDDDEKAEEADDEGAGLDEADDDEGAVDEEEEKKETHPNDSPPRTAANTAHPMPKTTPGHATDWARIGTRFISPRRPAEPRLSADEAGFGGGF